MSIKELDDQRREFVKTYTAKELFDLVFTDYKNAPSELAKIPNLETLAKQRVSQLVDATGIKPAVIEEFFNFVQEVIIETIVEAETAVAAEVTTATVVDAGVGGGDGGGGGG